MPAASFPDLRCSTAQNMTSPVPSQCGKPARESASLQNLTWPLPPSARLVYTPSTHGHHLCRWAACPESTADIPDGAALQRKHGSIKTVSHTITQNMQRTAISFLNAVISFIQEILYLVCVVKCAKIRRSALLRLCSKGNIIFSPHFVGR